MCLDELAMPAAVKRLVANLLCSEPGAVAEFYRELFGLDIAMDMGWIATLTGDTAPIQLSLARDGGSNTPLPALSVEVDDLEAVLAAAKALGAPIEYGPVTETWGVRRFYLRDPAGTLINVLTHSEG